MALVVARMIALLEAETTQFHARMTAAETQLTKWTSATTSGRRGTVMLQQGLQQLAFQAAGIPGPMGKVVASIGMLGAGSATVLVALAGIGAITAAYKLAAERADTLRASTDRLNASYRGIVSAGKPLVVIQNQILQAVQQQSEAQAELDRLSATVTSPRGRVARGTPGEIALAQANVDAAARVVAALRVERQQALVDRTTALGKEQEEAVRRASLMRVIPDRGEGLVTGEQLFARDQARMRGQLDIAIARADASRFHIAPVQEMTAPEKGGRFGPEQAQMLLFSLMAMRGGGAGGALMGLGGLAGGAAGLSGIAGTAAAGPLGWAGFGLTALGSLFTSNADKNASKIVDAIERMAKEVGLERVTLIFSGPDGHQIRRNLAELEESDAVERVPGPTGAGG